MSFDQALLDAGDRGEAWGESWLENEALARLGFCASVNDNRINEGQKSLV